jgi:hypothetical protein
MPRYCVFSFQNVEKILKVDGHDFSFSNHPLQILRKLLHIINFWNVVAKNRSSTTQHGVRNQKSQIQTRTEARMTPIEHYFTKCHQQPLCAKCRAGFADPL